METNKKYKVLWFDDEFDSLDLIKENGKLNGIQLYGFDNAKEGIDELSQRIEEYDAVIVDGKFYEKPGQTGDALGDQALFNVGITLESLQNRRKIPWFILSGQISFTKEKNRYADGFKNNKVYDKTIESDILELWKDIKFEADQQVETQIRHKYQRVFDVCTEKYIGEEAARKLINAIKIVESDTETSDTEDFFNSVRKVIEKLFIGFNKIGVLPDEILNNSGWLNNSSKFLCNTHQSYKLNQEILHPAVSFNLRHIMQIIQDASHNEGVLTLRIDEHVRNLSTPYLYKSIVLQLLDIILWFKSFSDDNPDISTNRLKFSYTAQGKGDEYHGVIEQDSLGNYYCGEYLLNSGYLTSNNYSAGDRILIKESSSNTNSRNKYMYPKFATKFVRE